MSLPHDAPQANLDPVDAAGGERWWVVDQAVAMPKRGIRLANKRSGQQHTLYMSITAA
ncbi:hypothetical protein QT562_22310 [Xanthomonas citri pv. citri]|uniref:Uncharacterized protein n=2 Tax=Xanthomonas citri TaxID=346 RepID=A0A0U5FFC5_XANCI|nr:MULTISPECIES: hypothetical protein [Xanthomonas]AJD69233.1 hypothetical protein J151_02819 [Xanthomonas citri subsp. citri A306]AJY82755.1 hypothetical protein J159_02804 [Xanthomonas citri pv. citri]AJY87179.1 hypothetical protein J158_02806 [Xanthomonas citri subsp. citri UI6]AJY91614.1 hypothetical protein J169_02817 [Xanthomonas citri pv. citri]AJY96072.1 hypothetical protein J164_02804 [Xanthomonas citri pv. citri]